jgi:PAS domain S-box-containing protein
MTDSRLSGSPTRSEGEGSAVAPDPGGWRSPDMPPGNEEARGLVHYGAQIAVLAVAYLLTAKLGLSVPVAHGNATPVWAPTGISLAALILFGTRLWPGVALGALIANATTAIPLWAAVGIAVGNTFEALAGTYLLRRVGFRHSLDRVRDVLALVGLAALLSTAISATIGATSLRLAGAISWSAYPFSWSIWWFGDAMGDLLVAPALLVWVGGPRAGFDLRRSIEAAVLVVLLIAVSSVVFFWTPWAFAYAILFPLLIWAALRFGQRGVTVGALIVACSAVWGTLIGSTPIAGASQTENVAILQAQMSVIAVALLVLAATITERQRADVALRDSEERFRRIFEDGPLGLVIVDHTFRLVRVNKALCRMLGYAASELEGLSFVDITHPDDVDTDVELAERALRGIIPGYQIQKRYLKKNGDVVPISLTASIVRDTIGNPMYGLGIIEDVSERHRAEEALRTALKREREAAERQRQLDQLKNEFVTMIAHDLRSPLGVIGSVAHVLRENWDVIGASERREFLDSISHRATDLSRLVHDVLDLAAIESGELPYDVRPFDLGALVKKIVDELNHAHPARTFNVNVPKGLPAASGDRDRNWQILFNLLGNAIKFSSEEDPIDVSVSADDLSVRAAVRDRGIGIAAEDLPKLFQRFVRLSKGGERIEGSGLGLYLCKMMVEAQGGRIWVESQPGVGSTFSYTLPVAGR